MTDLTKFLRYVLPYATGCSEISATNALRQAAIDFCRRTNLWTEMQEPQPVIAGISEYDIESPTDGQLSLVLDVYLDGVELSAKAIDELRKLYKIPSWNAVVGKPVFFTQLVPGTIQLVPEPATDIPSGVSARVSYVPTQTASTVPDFLYDSHATDLASGALSYLLIEQGRSYTDPTNGVYHARRFHASMSRAVVNNNRANVRAQMRVRQVRV